MDNLLESIEITGLYGIRDYTIKFDNNKLILVGENGSGKTTISRIIYATLSCNWDLLRTYPFENIKIHFSTSNIELTADTINDIFGIPGVERLEYFVERHSYRHNFDNFISVVLDAKDQCEHHLDLISSKKRTSSGIPYEYIDKVSKNPRINELYNITNEIKRNFKSKILYLPTYRRIEEQLKTIFPDIEKEVWRNSRRQTNSDGVVELVEFGMDDVEYLVKREQDQLMSFSQSQQNKLTLGYLGEIVTKSYDNSSIYSRIRQLSNDEIKTILARIDPSILSLTLKNQLFSILNKVRYEHKHSYSAQVKILCHYFMKLAAFNKDISNAEKDIRTFQNICNKYLLNNQILYNSQDFTCSLVNKVNDKIDASNTIAFQDLSSGEKQIVSLFSHLFLEKDSSVFVFIDEPELSLSVDWQRSFLPDILSSPKCVGLMATTHSPFIFDNNLENVVHGINEFCTRG